MDILKARGRVQSAIARSVNPKKECFQAISILSAVINIQHSQELIETQGVVTFNKYVARLRKKKTKAAKSLIQDPNFGKAIYLAREAEKHGLEHPKLKKVTDIIKKELIKAGIDEAIKCRQTGEEKTIVINFSGHGMLDLKGYANYFSGEMPNSK